MESERKDFTVDILGSHTRHEERSRRPIRSSDATVEIAPLIGFYQRQFTWAVIAITNVEVYQECLVYMNSLEIVEAIASPGHE